MTTEQPSSPRTHSTPGLPRAIVGGFVATSIMTLMMYYVAPLMTGQPMDVAAMLASATGGSWAFGMTLHFINGSIFFPVAYALAVYPLLGGPPVARGAALGAGLWLLSQVAVMPMMGGGFFSSQVGGIPAVVGSLLGHLVYGGCLGAIAGTAQQRNPGVTIAEKSAAREDRTSRDRDHAVGSA